MGDTNAGRYHHGLCSLKAKAVAQIQRSSCPASAQSMLCCASALAMPLQLGLGAFKQAMNLACTHTSPQMYRVPYCCAQHAEEPG
jgi:hypothetical protein